MELGENVLKVGKYKRILCTWDNPCFVFLQLHVNCCFLLTLDAETKNIQATASKWKLLLNRVFVMQETMMMERGEDPEVQRSTDVSERIDLRSI